VTDNTPRTLAELAECINRHLKRFEADPVINAPDPRRGDTRPFFYAWASYRVGSKMSVQYISYQGASKLSKAEATEYLAWLDAGNVGRHYEALRGVSR